MRIGYSGLRNVFSLAPKQIAVALGLIALPVTVKLEKVKADVPVNKDLAKPVVQNSRPTPDPRTLRLQKFFAKLHCPVSYLAEDFVQAADDNHLDWRLLPSISVIESGGGKAYRNNNIFGWANGDHLFPTLRSAINEVAFKLGKSPLYRNRDVEGKLRIYNPDGTYPGNVQAVMNQISPVVNLRPARRITVRTNQFSYVSD